MRRYVLLFGLVGYGCSDDATTGGGGSGGAATTATSSTATSATSTAGSTASSAATGSTGSSSSTGGAPCDPPCGMGFDCCDGQCVNQANDILNCGACGEICPQDLPFCDNGTCGDPPCDGQVCIGTTFCCGANCCDLGMLCCVVQMGGPVGGPECTVPENGTCPPGNPGGVCAAPDTPIATPFGERAIADLREGDLVYSVNENRIVIAPLSRATRTAVTDHRVVELVLETGIVLRVSPRHPTADGRTFGDLLRGDSLGGRTIRSAELVPYLYDATYDILPDTDSGAYFAAGTLVGSTLGPQDAANVRASVAPPAM